MEKTREIVMLENNIYEKVNRDKIIVIGKDVYEKVNDNARLVIPHPKKEKTQNENEVILDGIGRIRLAQSIMNKMNIKTGYKLDVYASGRNIIIKKLDVKKSATRETKMIIENKYEVKVQISNLDFGDNHNITTIDEFGNILIWNDIRQKIGIVENDKLKVCITEDMMSLIPKKKY